MSERERISEAASEGGSYCLGLQDPLWDAEEHLGIALHLCEV